MAEIANKQKIVGFQLLRGVAAFGIVGCHLSLDPMTGAARLLTGLCDFNVGVFAALAGVLMVDSVNRDGYIVRRFKRILPTYALWSLIYIASTTTFDLLFDGAQINPTYRTAEFWLKVTFTGGAACHLWFLICLFYAQMVLREPLRLIRNWLAATLAIIAGGIMIGVSIANEGWFYYYPLRLAAFLATGYGLGVVLKQTSIFHLPKIENGILWLIIAGVAMLHLALMDIIPRFARDWLAVGILVIAFYNLKFEGRSAKVAAFLGATSMGVFLIHPLVTRGLSLILYRFTHSPYGAGVVLGEWVAAWLLALVATVVLHKHPWSKKIVQ